MAIEAVVLLLVAVSPWPQGSYEAVSRFVISIALALLLMLWAIRLCLVRAWTMRGNGPLYCLAGLVLLSFVQLLALPAGPLSWLSPGSAETYSFYLPRQHEVLPGETGVPVQPDHSISIDPSDTREFLIEALALCILYGVVVNNIVSHAAFIRLAWVCAINGALISLLAFAQRLSSSEHVIYWSIVVGGHAFGPFDYRNIFPFFANACIGLGLGLLAAAAQKKGRAILQNVRALWLFTGLALTVTAVVFSFSRGGSIALVVALVLGGILWWRRGQGRSSAGMLLWLIPVVLTAASWIGWSALEKRYEGLAQDRSITEDRFYVWRDSIRHFPSFPVFGTGNGSFAIVEPMTRTNVGEEFMLYDHAHNEYVEALVEGGLVRLGLTIALVWVVTAAGARNYRHLAGRTAGWLVLGGLVGFWAMALHSFVDFGVHYPAIAILGTVLAAYIAGVRQRENASDQARVPLAACLLIAPCMVLLGGLLVREAFWHDRATRFRNAALLETRSPEVKTAAGNLADAEELLRKKETRLAQLRPLHEQKSVAKEDLDEAAAEVEPARARVAEAKKVLAAAASAAARRRIDDLEAAVACRPDNFRYRNELSHAYLDFSELARQAGDAAEADQRLRECLRQARAARDLSPAFVRPHVWLGLYRDLFEPPTAEAATWYFDRARRSTPTDPSIWFACGKERFDSKDWSGAWNDWRQTLAISINYLEPVWFEARSRLTAEQFLDNVLPDNPEVIRDVADRLFPPGAADSAEMRKPFLVKALALVERRGDNRSAKDEWFRGRLLRELGRYDESIAALRRGLEKDPNLLECRRELVDAYTDRADREIFAEAKCAMFEEAKRQVEYIILHDPEDLSAKERLQVINRELLIDAP